MQKGRVTALAVLLTGLTCATAWAGGTAERLLKEAGNAYARRTEKGQADKARGLYEQVLAIDDANVTAYWKIAQVYWWKGSHESTGDAKIQAFREGIEFAKLAVEVDAKSAPAHFWLAALYGSFGEEKGIMQSLNLIEPMRKELEKVLKLDPKFEWGGAHRVLCRLYHKAPGFKGGDIKKAIEHGRKAVAIGPELPMNYRFLAEALLEDGQDAEAKKLLQQLLKLPLPEGRKPESKEERETAKKLLEDL